jgi:hypothetical protein
MKECMTYSLDALRDYYRMFIDVRYVYYIPLADNEEWHPYYEIVRRAEALAAMRQALNERVFEDAQEMRSRGAFA